jgi:hypothetical protein
MGRLPGRRIDHSDGGFEDPIQIRIYFVLSTIH